MSWTPGVVPYGADETTFLVVDSLGALGSVYRETEIERADLETVISDLMGQGMPAPPQPQARGPSHGRSAWTSQTPTKPKPTFRDFVRGRAL